MLSTSEFASRIHDFDLGSFLTQYQQMDPEQFVLGNKGTDKEWIRLLAEQLKIYPKARLKLPEFVHHHCWFTSRSYQQCSGTSAANFKASLFKGDKMLDLSGGLGVDDWAFSKHFNSVVSLDSDHHLNSLSRENFRRLGALNIDRIDTDAETYLFKDNIPAFDLIFLDADRRGSGARSLLIHEGTPNFLSIRERCFQLSGTVLLKLSPLADLSYLIRELTGVRNIWVVGNQTEALEILCEVGPAACEEPSVYAVIADHSNIIQFNANQEIPSSKSEKLLLFEAHPVIIKSGLAANYAKQAGLNILSPGGILAVGNTLPHQPMGRTFDILHQEEFSKSAFRDYLKSNKISKANVTQRSFGQESAEIQKAYGIANGGEDYLFLFSTINGRKEWIHARKIRPGSDK